MSAPSPRVSIHLFPDAQIVVIKADNRGECVKLNVKPEDLNHLIRDLQSARNWLKVTPLPRWL